MKMKKTKEYGNPYLNAVSLKQKGKVYSYSFISLPIYYKIVTPRKDPTKKPAKWLRWAGSMPLYNITTRKLQKGFWKRLAEL